VTTSAEELVDKPVVLKGMMRDVDEVKWRGGAGLYFEKR
jgi:hypothetical protein